MVIMPTSGRATCVHAELQHGFKNAVFCSCAGREQLALAQAYMHLCPQTLASAAVAMHLSRCSIAACNL